MQPNISVASVSVKALPDEEFPDFCKLPIRHTERKLLYLKKGQILQQSFKNYMANFDLFESSLTEPDTIHFTVNEPGIFLFMVLKGHAIFSDHDLQTRISSSRGHCYLGHIPAGHYNRPLCQGEHITLLFSLLPDWFIYSAKDFLEFKSFTDQYLTGKALFLNLPQCALTQSIVRHFKRTLLQDYPDETELDYAIFNFLNKLLFYYHAQLTSKAFNTAMLRRKKAEELESFIKENFTREIVDDTSKMAGLFCVSEKTFLRLAKAVFGVPLHEQVIRLRMNYGIKLVLTTKKPIYEIAEMIGYHDALYFSKVFKKYHNVSPGKLR